jgi:hypothetical protein
MHECNEGHFVRLLKMGFQRPPHFHMLLDDCALIGFRQLFGKEQP